MSNDYHGCSDPDYYDIEFREQNPEVYGNDEVMPNYHGSRARGQQRSALDKGHTSSSSYNDHRRRADAFHQDYEQWRRDHPDKIKFFRSKSDSENNFAHTWPLLIVGLLVWGMIIAALVQSCE